MADNKDIAILAKNIYEALEGLVIRSLWPTTQRPGIAVTPAAALSAARAPLLRVATTDASVPLVPPRLRDP